MQDQCQDLAAELSRRKKAVLKELCIIAVLGIVYLAVFLHFGVGIPCLFHKFTGLLCPGCGMTRALAALFRGHIDEAIQYNLLSVTLLPVIVVYLLYRAVRYVRGKDGGFYVWEYVLLAALFSAAVFYGIWRNHFI